LLNTRLIVPAVAVGFIALVAIWAVMRPFRSHTGAQLPSSAAVQPAERPAAAPAPDQQNPQTSGAPPSFVLHQEIPEVSRGARGSIRGQIKVTVRVTVDRAGNVVAEALESRGSSRYFARLATAAARKWKFVPTSSPDARKWLLEFDFSRAGVAGRVANSQS
jgi:outer membrane biosynthesis protein TonB